MIFISAEPLKSGLAIVPPTLTVERDGAIELVQHRNELPDEMHRAPRHLDFRADRRPLVELSVRDQLGNVERQMRLDLHRLDAGLLHFSVDPQFVILETHPEVDRGRLQLLDRISAQTLQLQIEVRAS